MKSAQCIRNSIRYLSACAIMGMAAPAHAMSFSLPVACELGITCFVQNYVDHDPAPGARDHQCGSLTYDGHKGTDFRLRDFAAMHRGVNVLAAADGKVLRLRNHAPDTGLDAGKEVIGNRKCGNGLVVAHAEGFETQYCHLKQGSITVRAGDAIRTGMVIGKVGYSGATEFPHLHFQVTKRGKIVDPYHINSTGSRECHPTPNILWSADALKSASYINTAVLGAGFSNTIPQRDSLHRPLLPMQQIAAISPVLTMWVEVMGIQSHDTLTMEIIAPDGSVFAQRSDLAKASKAAFFQYIGKKLHAPLMTGAYVGKISVIRQGLAMPYASTSVTVSVKPDQN